MNPAKAKFSKNTRFGYDNYGTVKCCCILTLASKVINKRLLMMMIYEFSIPTEENYYRLFNEELESNPLVFFHTTPKSNFESIMENGFKFGPILQSVSYANKSSHCLAHRGRTVTEDYVVFVVEFASLDINGIKINSSDIHVFREDIQPTIKGYCIVPKEYVFS